MPAGQAPEQLVRRVEGRLGVEIVQDQEPTGILVQLGHHRLDLHGLLGGCVLRQPQRVGQGGEAGVQPVRRLGVQQR
jgi:hypothetical protein